MTTIELLHRLGRRTRSFDFTKLSMSDLSDLLDSANRALQETYNLLPDYYKEITEGFALPAPAPVNLTVVQYSANLSADVFSDSQIGCSVVLDGDPAWNQVVGRNALLNPYMGASGVVNGTAYGDAWYSTRYPFNRVISDPWFANRSFGILQYPGLTRVNGPDRLWPVGQVIGQPLRYWGQMLGNSQGNEPMLVLRFAPAPDIAYSMSVRTSYWPKRLTMANYTTPSTLVAPDQYLESVLIPLGLRALMSTPIWDTSRKDEAAILAAAERAEAFAKNQPGQIVSPSNGVFTPLGY